MLLILLPVALLFLIILVPSIPRIGGEPRAGLLIAGITAALLGGLGIDGFISASVFGIDKIAWVIMLSFFGSIYAQSQVELGTMDTVLDTFRSIFGKSPKGLIATVIIVLTIGGSLLGDAIAAATVIGVLVVMGLHEMGLKGEHIGCIILSGAILGSVMPPISQACYLSASLVGMESPAPVIQLAYLTVGIGVLIAILIAWRFVKIKQLPEDLIPEKSAAKILSEKWYTLLPLLVLIAIVVLASAFNYNIFKELAFFVAINKFLSSIPVIQGITFRVVEALVVVLIMSFFFPAVYKKSGSVIKEGIVKVNKTVQIQLCAGVMIGAFYKAGLIDIVKVFAENLGATAMKLGGGIAVMLVGMLTGSQTTAQTTIVTFLGPALKSLDVSGVNAALGSAHLAMAGQSMPPVGLTAFVVVGVVGGIINEKVDPVKVMFLALPVTAYFAISGFLLLFI
ncbi:MAG: TRAP transporter large permease subunit [Clostridiales bacterium]|nr:TRAP transporter large permease subunit [Clostridiales bacterium]MCF8023830.1 TRAP transporter large permease subunit [Clostridiales bacterium]